MSFEKLIHDERRSKPTPKNILKEDGTCEFGTFDKEFEQMDFLKIKKPTYAPQCMNKIKLTLWEASEINLKEGVVVVAVSDMGIFGKILAIFYDKRDKNIYTWDLTLPKKNATVSKNLLNGAETVGKTKDSEVVFVNNFENGKAVIRAKLNGKCKVNNKEVKDISMTVDVDLTRLSLPCVVSIPFDEKKPRPLYSQKDFFKAEGSVVFNGEALTFDEEATAIIDDHRGYYPRKAHYDWVTTMGINQTNGEKKYFAFNLTRNQSVNQDKYNENLIWFKGSTSLLTPVKFEQTIPTRDFLKKGGEDEFWTIKDEHGMVNLKFHIHNLNSMELNVGLVKINYYFTFGVLEGEMYDEQGNKYILDGMVGIGEDKTLLF